MGGWWSSEQPIIPTELAHQMSIAKPFITRKKHIAEIIVATPFDSPTSTLPNVSHFDETCTLALFVAFGHVLAFMSSVIIARARVVNAHGVSRR